MWWIGGGGISMGREVGRSVFNCGYSEPQVIYTAFPCLCVIYKRAYYILVLQGPTAFVA